MTGKKNYKNRKSRYAEDSPAMLSVLFSILRGNKSVKQISKDLGKTYACINEHLKDAELLGFVARKPAFNIRTGRYVSIYILTNKKFICSHCKRGV